MFALVGFHGMIGFVLLADDLKGFSEQEELVKEIEQLRTVVGVGIDAVFVDEGGAHPFGEEVIAEVFKEGASEDFLDYPDRVFGDLFDEARGFEFCP